MANEAGAFGMLNVYPYVKTSKNGELDIQGRPIRTYLAKIPGYALYRDWHGRGVYCLEEGYDLPHYVCRWTTRKEVIAIWHGWLRSRGVEV